MTLKLDLVGSRFTQSVVSDSSYTRRFSSDNLSGSNALDYIAAGLASLPTSGSQLSATPPLNLLFLIGANIDRVECDNDNPGQGVIYGTLEYATVNQTQATNPEPNDNGVPIITSGASVESVTTWTDRNGLPIIVQPPAAQAGQPAQPVAVTYDAPTSIRTFQRLESSDPGARSDVYVGRVNSATWIVSGKTNVLAGYAKCNRLVGTSSNGGASYTVDYEFAIMDPGKPGGWQPEVAWIDKDTGNPDPSSTVGDGIQIADEYPEANFNSLNL